MFVRSCIVGLGALMILPAAARAQDPSPVAGRWSFSFRGGLGVPLSGDVHGGGSGTVLGLPTSVSPKGYSDVYGTSFRGEAQLGYALSDRVELVMGGSYESQSAEALQVGNVAGLALNAQFSDYEEIGVEAGLRYFLGGGSSLRPYLTATGGLLFVEENRPTFSVPAADVTLNDVPFYDSSTVGTFGAGVGVRLDVSPKFSVGAETLARYHAGPDRTPTLTGTGLEDINDTGDRWSMPILFTATLRF
jgi:hypothetical protein